MTSSKLKIPESATASVRRGRYGFSIKTGMLVAFAVLLPLAAFYSPELLGWYQARKILALLDSVQLAEAKAYASSVAGDSKNPDVLLASVRAYRMSGDAAAAGELLKQSESLIADSDRIQKEALLNAACRGELNSPTTEIPRLLSDPDMDSRDVCESYVIGFRLNRSFHQASLLIEAWKKDWPQDPRPWFHVGLLNQTVAKWETALEAYEKASKRNADFPTLQRRLGQCLAQLEHHDSAIGHFRMAVQHDPTDLEAWLGLGESLQATGASEDARQAFMSALEIDSGDFGARIAIAEIDFLSNRVAMAESIVKDLLEIWPEDVRALYLQSQIASIQGQTELASKALERWKVADQAVLEFEALVPVLAEEPDRLDLQMQIGEGLLKHYSRHMGRQYLLAAVQMSASRPPTADSKAVDLLRHDELQRAKLQALPLPRLLPADSEE